jgi:hypothetical protein
MQIFAEVLFGHREFSTGPMPKRPSYRSLWEFAVAPPESALLWASAGLLLLSLIATLTHQ